MNQSQILASRLGTLGEGNALNFLRQSVPTIIEWIASLAVDALPDRETVLDWVESAIQDVLESTDFPVVDDKLVDPFVLQALMALAAKAYDMIAKDGPAI